MAKFEPKFETALEQHDFSPVSSAAFKVEELRDYGYVVLRINPQTAGAAEAVARLGLSLPEPLKMTGSLDSRLVKWIGPTEYGITLPLAQKDEFIKTAKEALQGVFSALVDNSGGYSLLRISGTQRYEVLSKLALYDLRGQLPIGKVVSTIAAKAGVIVYRLEEDSLRIMVRWSFAVHFLRSLEKASEEFR